MLRTFTLFASAVILLLLSLTSVYAAPSLSLGTTASYNLSGRLHFSSSCDANPSTFAGEVCGGTVPPAPPPPLNATLNGEGSFVVPSLISSIGSSYSQINPSVRVNYRALGSGTGITDLSVKTIDFAASDLPLANTQIGAVPNSLTIPETLWAVALAYNLPGVASGLHLNATVAAEIFQGNITHWNDASIQELNPGLPLPTSAITVVHRADASAATFLLSTYLNTSYPVWKLGVSKTIQWPSSLVSLGVASNAGEAAVIQATANTIGYVESESLSASSPLTVANIWNAAGHNFVAPSLAAIRDAAFSVFSLPPGNSPVDWQSLSLVNSNVPTAYPIASFSYIILYQELNVYGSAMTQDRALALVGFLSFMIHLGQNLARSSGFAPLPSNVVSADDATIQMITYNGQHPERSPPAHPIVAILDDGICSPNFPPNDPFEVLNCRFDPNNVTITQGGTVQWINLGNLTHTVTSNQTANIGLAGFDSGIMARAGSFTYTFSQPGVYHYYDSILGPILLLMRGAVTVNPQPPPPPPTSAELDLTGNVGWSVEGLSSSQANLLVSHQVNASICPSEVGFIVPVCFAPLSESGSFEQSINLSTRVESPGTAESILESVLTSALQGLAGPSLTTGGSGPALQSMLSDRTSTADYTQWWVNGPLSLGSPVQILNGWSSVTGSESLNLGGSIGTRSAWIATSELSQTFNLNIPNPSNLLGASSSSTASANLNMLWSFDKSADLLLRTNDTLSLNMTTVSSQLLQVGCPPSCNFPPVLVTVTHVMTINANLAMRLSSTTISLAGSGHNGHALTFIDMLAAIPWMPYGIAGLAAGAAVAMIAWFVRRSKVAVPGSAQPQGLTPSTASPS